MIWRSPCSILAPVARRLLKPLMPHTLRARLSILFAVSTSLLLVFNGVLLYHSLKTRFDSTSAREMTATLTALQLSLQTMSGSEAVRADREIWYDLLHGHPNLDIALFDARGAPLTRTNGYWPNVETLAVHAGLTPVQVKAEGMSKRFLVAMAPLGGQSGANVRVVVQYDTSAERALLRAYALNVLLVSAIGTLVNALLAWWIARFGLRPLARLTARAEQISSSRLARPLPERDMPGELKELSHAFNRMLARLHESFTRLTQFSSDLAHDMRTPLTNLLAEAQVALSQPRSADDYRVVIESSVDEFQRLSRLIDSMLFLARADSAQRRLSVQQVDARSEALRVAGYYESMAADAGVEIVVTGDACFEGDVLLVQRALSNLVSNALAHAPRGSTVELHCAERFRYAQLSVSDSGAGIAEPHLERIFDRFYRVDPARYNSARGTGLGLAIVKSIMNEHHGECSVESIPHERTTFSLHFPRRPAALSTPPVQRERLRKRHGK
ncbi:Sensor protein CzcS [Paraburkholderia domus]|uniref:heavy metal sensor histidine kinase n=1 Tax=Paraburkholderia domus TaxID=2793075 RepID=UPI00191353A5|nr:heavy metal sensor histidine kinase [Paraburkholderia domus]MBK5086707.1 heavy metal sensor histidine kinase [Burkholderia sp. R-69927]MBK5182447.1 heavy metal sensor histidine kinase [Burkholderia sp. R-69749]CAE6844762.1 Sensor protein CzcS [Paraburkholderia domus]CAE6851889.1 Sensor protein CzcS [Paraburkholderia domus]